MLSCERLLSFEEVAQLVHERTGRRPAFCTIARWASRGVAGIRLDTLCVGRKSFTTARSLEEFFRQVAQARLARGGLPRRTPAERRRASARAAAELARRGA